MQAIVESGLGDYYRFRTEPAQFGVIPDKLAARLDEVGVFDEPEISERYLQPVSSDDPARSSELVDVNLSVEGMRCGACVWVLERSIAALPGVERSSVNFSSGRASVRFDIARLKLSDILRRVAQMGYSCAPFDARERELALKRESRVHLQRLFVAGIATMQVMMYALPAYLSGDGDIDPSHESLMRWASLVLTTPVLLYSAVPFLKGAWLDLKRREPGMDVPVSIGILAAFFSSVWATVTGTGEIYFDSVAMFVFLLSGARYLEWAARRRAMRAVDDISAAAPETAQRLVGDELETVPAARLDVDDLVLINTGERVPVDSVVQAGHSDVNNALVTGESVPVPIGPGDVLAGGSLLTGAPVQVRVLRRQAASTLSVIDRLIDRGATEKPRAVRIADRIATVFVTALLVFAAMVWLVWMQLDATRAATTAIAVLVVSCPCALSLATPAALAAATGDLLRSRLLITRGHALETLARVTDVVFDKTGTLTTGAPTVSGIQLAQGWERSQVLQLATALEMGSTHPYAHALRQASSVEPTGADAIAELVHLGYVAVDLEHCAGHGLAASIEPTDSARFAFYVGSANWCGVTPETAHSWQAADDEQARAASEVFLAQRSLMESGGGLEPGAPVVLARFLISDSLRDEALSLVRGLIQDGLTVHLLSGDRLPAVQVAAQSLGIAQYTAGVTPTEKQAYVAKLQAGGATVLMVGDGINDAPVLASADVSLAAGEATALARTAADVISLLPGLEGLEPLLAKSVQTMKIVRQNLAWAAIYNVTAIPLAALGYVPPWAAAIGMAASSLLVVSNAQRLWSRPGSVPVDSVRQPRSRLWNRYIF
ncbi:putative copper-importing P-type ATPase A [Granulosicoccus antarcticus IMCC3135]|uniref:Putative copper-importing P-type ATPase A n=2 Tax=Granulosicoccus TaxID=437504 RepID=A0A2Z2NXN1_9GAMM|nr:putative copper-importing P-type ATPase A [Granulosicoccus antarcticus IMCC3135]